MALPHHHRADKASPSIGDELSRTNIVEIENSPNNKMKWKMEADMKRSLVKGHLARTS